MLAAYAITAAVYVQHSVGVPSQAVDMPTRAEATDDDVDEMIMPIHRRLSSYADGGEDAACWRAKLMVTCDTGLPGVSLDVAWNSSGETLIRDAPFSALAVMHWPADMNVTIKPHGFAVDHANFHACQRREGFCSPFVAAQPGLVTHSPALKSHTGSLALEVALDAGLWTLIAHFRMYVDGGVRIDIAKGITVEVKGIVPEEDLNQLSGGLRAFSYVLLGINLGMAVFFAGWVAIHRNAKVIANSQPLFLYVVALGCAVSSCTIVALGVDDGESSQSEADAACASVPWTYSLGFCLTFSALFAKLLRIKRIFLNPSMANVMVRNRDVIKPMLAIMLVDVALLTAWTFHDPLKYERSRRTSDYDVYGYPLRSHGVCNSSAAWQFIGPLIALHVSLLLYANFTAFATRKVKSDYQESTWVALSMGSQFQILVLAIPVLFMVAEDPISSFFLRVGVIFFNDAGVLLLIFLPKLLRFYRLTKVGPDGHGATANDSRTSTQVTVTHTLQNSLQAELNEALQEISMLNKQIAILKVGPDLSRVSSSGAILYFAGAPTPAAATKYVAE